MQEKLHKKIGFSLMLFAPFFLFEPCYALIDPLPDFIGYTILCIALMNLADINDKMASAFKSFCKASALNICRFISLLCLESMFSDEERSIGQLLFVFVFAILELIILIPAYRAFFEGLLTLAMFEGGEAVYYKKRDGEKNVTERMYGLTLFFLIFKNIVCALPEFTSLQNNTSYEFIGVIRTLAIIVVAPVSLVWLAHTLRYITRIKGDIPFITALSEKYEKKAEESPDFFTCRKLTITLYAVLIALLFAFDFYAENINLLPDFIFYGAVMIWAISLRRSITHRICVVALSAFGTISSVAIAIAENHFFSEFTIEAVIKNLDAYNLFNLLVCLNVIESAIFIPLMYCLLRAVYGIFDKYVLSRHEENDSYVNEHGKTLRTRGIICFAASILAAISALYRVLSLPYHHLSWIYYYSGIIASVVQISFIASSFAFILYLVGEIKYNYKTSL